MADKNDGSNDEVSVVPGTDEFQKMLFKLNKPVTQDNLGDLDYNAVGFSRSRMICTRCRRL